MQKSSLVLISCGFSIRSDCKRELAPLATRRAGLEQHACGRLRSWETTTEIRKATSVAEKMSEIVKKHQKISMLEGSSTKIARAVRAGPAGPASSRAYVSLVTFFAP